MLNISFGFYLVDKEKMSFFSDLPIEDFKRRLDERLDEAVYNHDKLKNILLNVDEKKYHFGVQRYYYEMRNLSRVNQNIVSLYRILASCTGTLSNYFFLMPSLYLSSNNFNMLPVDSFVKLFYFGKLEPINMLDINYSFYMYKLNNEERLSFLKDLQFLKDATFDNDFDQTNAKFIINELSNFDIESLDVIIAKTV